MLITRHQPSENNIAEDDAWRVQKRVPMECGCLTQASCIVTQNIAHDMLIRACEYSQSTTQVYDDRRDVMWSIDSAEEVGICPNAVNISVIDNEGTLRASWSAVFNVAYITFAVSYRFALC